MASWMLAATVATLLADLGHATSTAGASPAPDTCDSFSTLQLGTGFDAKASESELRGPYRRVRRHWSQPWPRIHHKGHIWHKYGALTSTTPAMTTSNALTSTTPVMTTTLSECDLTEKPDRGWRQVGLSGGPTKDLHLFPMVQVGDKTYLHGGVTLVNIPGQASELQQAHPSNVVFVFDWPSLSWSQMEWETGRTNGGFLQYGHIVVWTGEYFLAYGGARGRPGRGTGEEYALVHWDISGDSLTQTRISIGEDRTGTWPLHRGFLAGVWNTDSQTMLIFGGALTAGGDIGVEQNRQVDELWEYEPLAATWTDLTATSKAASAAYPTARRLPHAFWDSAGSRMMVYGGVAGDFFDPSFVIHDDIWAYSRDSNTWHQIVQTGPLPAPRLAPQVAWTGSGLLVFGGRPYPLQGGWIGDGWWEFSMATGQWEEIWPRDPGLAAAGLPPGGDTSAGAATFEPCRKAMLIHGGGSFYFFGQATLGTVEFGLGADA